MVFAIRKMRMCDDLKDYKVCLINDRKDLEKQLGVTAELTGEKVTYITSSDALEDEAGNGHVQPEHGHGPQVPGDTPSMFPTTWKACWTFPCSSRSAWSTPPNASC